jgi:hypothetical protein
MMGSMFFGRRVVVNYNVKEIPAFAGMTGWGRNDGLRFAGMTR